MVQAGGDPAQPIVQLQPGGRQRRQPIVGQGGAHRGEVAPYDLRCRVVSSFSAAHSIGRMPRTRFFNSFLAWRSASEIGLAASRR